MVARLLAGRIAARVLERHGDALALLDEWQGADALVLLTEWNEFMRLDLRKVKKLLKTPLVVDLRNIYKRDEMQKVGLRYVSIGRAAV